MGRKIPIDIAQKLAKTQKNESIFNQDNPYGYKINVSHPEIKPLYERYKEKLKAIILSDKQRFEFEIVIFKMIERKKNEQVNASRQTDSRPGTETDPERNRFV